MPIDVSLVWRHFFYKKMRGHTRTLLQGYAVHNDDERIELIRNAIFESLNDPLTIWVARAIVSECPSRDEKCELRRIHEAVKRGPIPFPTERGTVELPALRFVEDPIVRDTYPTARTILEWLAEGANGEDCDGHTILIDSLAAALGYVIGAVIVSRQQDQGMYTHIFPVAGVPRADPTDWLPLETTVSEARPGWMPSSQYNVKRMKVYALMPGSMKGRVFYER